MTESLSENTLNIDIEGLKALVAEQPITNINAELDKDVITPTHFVTEELEKLKNGIRQIYLIDISECEQVTEDWIKGLNNIILGANLADIPETLVNINDERFKQGLVELIPDTALTLNINVNGQSKILFIGYIDSNQAYRILGGYIKYLIGAKLYKIIDNTLKEIKETDITGLRVHL